MTICGTSTAVTPQQNTTISHNNTTTISTLQLTSKATTTKKAESAGDPIINGTVTINEYGAIRNLPGATVIINSTSGRTLAITTTNANGYYSTNFYSNSTQFEVTTSYLGCNSVTNYNVTVAKSSNPNDPNYYGTSNSVVTPIQAWWNGNYGYAYSVYITHYSGYFTAGEIKTATNSSSTIFNSYCIDIYTEINPNNILLVNGPLPGTTGNLSSAIDWGAVNYVISHYSPSSPSSGLTSNQMGAAIQCAIWALTTVQYPAYNSSNPTAYYHFLTAPKDALDSSGGSEIRTEALAIASTASANSMVYPSTINVTPQITRIANGQPVTITATVLDNKGNPLSGATVNFQTTGGTLSSTTGTTNSNGQATVTISNIPSNSSVTVTASVSGNYGNLLYDNPLDPKQNLVAENILPQSLLDISIINSDITANVALSQTVNSPVNVGNTMTYTVTATNNGPNTATGIIINDVLPSGFTATPSIGTYYNNTWVIASLASGSSATLTITGTAVANMAGTNVTNTATETGQDQYNSQLPTTTANSYVNNAVLTITNTGTTPVNVGSKGTFTITATNNGPDTATNIKITDALPNGFTAGLPTQGTYNSTTGIWTITSLTSGQTATLTFTGPITAAMAGTNITNTATATWTEYPGTVTIPQATIYVKEANVAITQTTSSSPVNVGNTMTYTVTATNNGPDTATNIIIDDTIPTGFTATPSIGTYTNGVWTIPTLAMNGTATLTITGTATSTMAGTNTTNTATRTSQTEYNNQPTTSVSAPIYTKQGNITVTNTATSSPLNVGQTGTFTITATNNGPDTATNIKITDALPNGFTAGTPTQGTYNSTTGIWTITSLTNGQTATLTFTGPITAAMAGTNITNTATATWTEYPGTVTIPQATIYVKEANVAITQTTSTSPVNVGNPVTYTVTATNNGPDTATNIIIDDTIPTGFTATPSIGTYTNGVWTIPTLAMNGTATLTITGTATSTMAGTNTTNTATRTSQTEYNNQPTTSVSAPIYTKQGNITVTNTATSSPLNVGQTGTFTITATNNGPDTATNIKITDALPNGFTAGTPTQGTYNSTTGIWTITSLTNGQTATLTFTGPITAAMAGTNITNTATATWTEYPGTVTIPQATIYVKEANVAITQTTSTSPVNVGNPVTYTVTTTNNGPDTATNIIIDDTIPTGFTATPSIGTYTNGVWTIPTLAMNGTATLTITGNATAAMAGTNTTNTATRISQTEYNNQPTTSVSAPIYTKQGNITVTNTATSSPLNVGQTGTFTITATNNGPDTATNIKITDALPNGFTAGTPTQGTYNSTTGIWTITSLTNGQTATLTFTGPITAAMAGTNITNTATATWTEYPGTVTIPQATIYVKEANVAITQTTSTSPVNVGNPVTYTVTTTNNGPDTATNIIIDDTIPTGFTATPSIGTYTNGVWTIPTLAMNGTATLTITGNATAAMAGTNTTNTATRISQTEYNNQPTTSVSAPIYTKQGNITVTNTATSSPLNVGQTGTFTITATNNGPDTATNIKITDALPNGFTAGTPTQGTYNSTTGIWTITSLTNGQTATLTFTGPITAAMAGTNITNTATATWTEYPGTVTIPQATIYINKADPIFTQTVNGQNSGNLTVNVNDPLTFIITVENMGPDSDHNINILDIIPSGLNNANVIPSVGTYNINTGIWNIPVLDTLGTATLTITGTAGSNMAGLSTTNTATEINQTEYDPTPGTTTSIPVYTKLANVSISQAGGYSKNTVTFIVTATNNGPDNATNINIKDLIPSGLTGYNVTPSIGTYNSTTGIWTITSLLNGTFATLNITGTATPQSTTYNNATKINQTEYDPNAPETTKLGVYVPSVNMNIREYPWYYDTLMGTYETESDIDNTIVYTVDVRNTGINDATGVIVNEVIGNGYQYINCSTEGVGTATYNNITNTLTWNIGNMPSGGMAWLSVFALINATGNNTPALTVTASLQHVDQYDTPGPRKSASYSIYVEPSADTQLNQTQTTTTQNNHTYITYTTNVTNNGPDTATNVQITDPLPTGLINPVVTVTTGTYTINNNNIIWTIPTLNNQNNATMTITAQINTTTGTLINTPQITNQDQNDWNYNNNAQTCYYTVAGTYTPKVNMNIREYPWYYDTLMGTYETESDIDNTIVYTVDVRNTGINDATGVIVNEVIGNGYQYLGCSTEGVGTATYNNITNTLTWNIGNMPSGGMAWLSVFALINATGNNTPALTVNASLQHVDQNDTPGPRKSASYSIYVEPSADTQLNQTTTTTTNNNTTTITYTITITNNGPNTATNIQINDQLPTNLTNITINTTTGNYTITNNNIIWTIPTLNNQNNATITITAQINTTTGTLINTPQITNQDQNDWNYNNNAQTNYNTQ